MFHSLLKLSHLSCWSCIWKNKPNTFFFPFCLIFVYKWLKVTHQIKNICLKLQKVSNSCEHFWFQWRKTDSHDFFFFPRCVSEDRAEGWGRVCDAAKRILSYWGSFSIYTCTFRKITSCISSSLSDNFFTLLYIQYITHNHFAYYTWLFIKEDICSLSTFQSINNPSLILNTLLRYWIVCIS